MTLFFFIPGSRPFRVRQKFKEHDDANRTDPKKKQAETPRHDGNTTAVGADNTVSTGNVSEDQTGWTQYYEELEAREAFDMCQISYVHYLYEGKSDKTPWYDRPYVEALLERWSSTKFAKYVRYVFKD